MKKHLPLIVAATAVVLTQVVCTWCIVRALSDVNAELITIDVNTEHLR